MTNQKQTCPICFTKMHHVNKNLVCPECGYKYCDHSYDHRDIYSTAHTHEPQYTTTSTQSRPTTASHNATTTYNRNTSGYNNNSTGQKSPAAKIIIIVIAVYFLVIIFSVFIPLILGFLAALS